MATMNTYFETNTHRHWLIDEKKTSWTLNAVSEASIKYTNAQYTLHTEKLRRMFHHPGIASGNLTLDHEEAQVRTTLYHTLSRGGRWWHWCGSHQVFRTRIEPTIRPGCRRWDRRRRTRGGHERNDCKWWCHLWYIHHEPSTCFPHWMIDRNERSDDDGKNVSKNATAMVYVESVLMICGSHWLQCVDASMMQQFESSSDHCLSNKSCMSLNCGNLW
jgi:hypothetical protein